MAGQNPDDPGFAADFRSGITIAMNLGLPQDPALRPTFRFPVTKTYETADRAGAPWEWDEPPVTSTPDPAPVEVQIPCAVEVQGQAVEITTGVQFDASTVTLTILDQDWALVEGFTEVLIGGNVYVFGRTLPALGLFDVTVRQVEVHARDES